MYCRVEDGVIVQGPIDLSHAWHWVDGVKCHSDAAYLAQDGWVPYPLPDVIAP